MRIIRGKYGRRRFDVPKNITARPTTDFARENIFNVIENYVDLDGLDEFLSRGCRTVTAVEKAATQQRFIQKVADELGDKNLLLVRGDALRYIASAPRAYDVVWADPPYDMPGFADIPGMILGSALLRFGQLLDIRSRGVNSLLS